MHHQSYCNLEVQTALCMCSMTSGNPTPGCGRTQKKTPRCAAVFTISAVSATILVLSLPSLLLVLSLSPVMRLAGDVAHTEHPSIGKDF